MGIVKRDLIEYNGITSCNLKNKNNFNQINLEEILCIPGQKPNIENINRIWIETTIKDYELVKTPIGISLEGQKMTGFNLLVCGELILKIEYVACEEFQSVHTFHISIPFCSYAVMEEGINPNSRIVPNIIVEDVFAEQIDCRCIYTNTTMMLLVDIC